MGALHHYSGVSVGFHIASLNSTGYELLLKKLVIYIWKITTINLPGNKFYSKKSLFPSWLGLLIVS